MTKPIRVFYSPLTEEFYASRQYRDNGDGSVTITGDKFNVTQDIARAIVHYEIEFKPRDKEAGDE